METSATADGFYFSVRSTRPVLLTRVRVGLRDGTAPTTVRVAVRRGGAAKRPQAAWREELAEFIRRRGDHFMSC